MQQHFGPVCLRSTVWVLVSIFTPDRVMRCALSTKHRQWNCFVFFVSGKTCLSCLHGDPRLLLPLLSSAGGKNVRKKRRTQITTHRTHLAVRFSFLRPAIDGSVHAHAHTPIFATLIRVRASLILSAWRGPFYSIGWNGQRRTNTLLPTLACIPHHYCTCKVAGGEVSQNKNNSTLSSQNELN